MIIKHDRRTKIVWSYEPANLRPGLASELVDVEFDAIRLVYETGSADIICQFLDELATVVAKNDHPIPVMIDVSARVRGVVASDHDPFEVAYGDLVKVTPTNGNGDIRIETDRWEQFFEADANVYIGFGDVVLNILNVKPDFAEAQVVQGGTVLASADVHIPKTRQDPKMTDFSEKELKEIFSRNVDFVVVPGFSSAEEIKLIKDLCYASSSRKPWMFLKLNSKNVYEKVADLLDTVHGVFISRRELALFMPPAMIPVLTKEVIQLCNDNAKIVLTASEMLGSMRHNLTPTRAEVSDVANVVLDGTDAVVLSEEISYGPHSGRAISLLRKIVEDVEQSKTTRQNWQKHLPDIDEEMDAVAYTAYKTAERVGAKAIVCLTKEGNTAVKLSSFRFPEQIIALTLSEEVLSRLSIIRGVDGILLDGEPVIDQVLPFVNDLLLSHSWLCAGDKIVFVSVTLSPLSRRESNLLTVQTLS